MARHRDVRNLDADDFESDYDYGSSYSGSYYDEVPLSASVEREYIYRRNASGTTPKLTHFIRTNSVPEEDETDEPPGPHRRHHLDEDSDDSSVSEGRNRRHSSGSSILECLDEEETKKLADCLEQILDIVGESMPEIHVKETIVKCDFNVELALNTLLNNPGVFHTSVGEEDSKTKQKSRKPQPRPTNLSPPPVPDSPAGQVPASKLPVISTTPIIATSAVATPISTKGETFATPTPPVIQTDTRVVPSVLNLSAKPNKKRLEIRSRTPSPASQAPSTGFNTPLANVGMTPSASGISLSSIVSTPSGSVFKMRKKDVSAAEEYAKVHDGDSSKALINLVVVGHVDSGKSTLMGHLLFLLGCVSSRVMHKYEQDSKKVGKQSFAYAWVLDETDEERSRGITMDVGQNRFETKSKSVTLLDAPGHRDFIPNMISGAYQADVAILVVNATRGEFEAGFDAGGQTREHALLVRSLGVTQLVVAVNKLDTVNWSQDRFNEIVLKLKQFLKQVGFKESDVRYVPCSGLTGENLVKKNLPDVSQWYQATPTLVDAIDTFAPPKRLIEKPFRLSISDVYKPSTGGSSSGFCVAGRIESGFVMPNDRVVIMPASENATVKLIARNESGVEVSTGNQAAFAGEHVSLIISGADQANISNGMVVCDPQLPVPVTKHFRAKIVVFNIDIPIIKGTTCVLHYGSVQTQATVKKLIALIDKSTGQPVPKSKGSKPRCLVKNTNALVEIATEQPICLELYSNIKELGRFMLRSGGKTIAAGMAVEIF